MESDAGGPRIRYSGISPGKLLEWVTTSAPYLFSGESGDAEWLRILVRAKIRSAPISDLYSYFDLCLAAHFSTVGSFFPTDVDLAIREKLWSFAHDPGVLEHLWERTRAFRRWDERPVSRRRVELPGGAYLSGIQGEWLTIAMGAYGTAQRLHSPLLGVIREEIEEELAREEEALRSLREAFLQTPDAGAMVRYLWGVSAIAHNLGDLDRMMDSCSIEDQDVLKRRAYRLGHEDARSPRPLFVEAGRIYQAMMASECHRNFALRAPKGLRKSSRFLLPFGLFLDAWGEEEVAGAVREGLLSEGELREVIEALATGWQKLNPHSIYASQGYARALAGISLGLGGSRNLEDAVPPFIRRILQESGLRTHLSIPRGEFERKVVSRLRRSLENPEA